MIPSLKSLTNWSYLNSYQVSTVSRKVCLCVLRKYYSYRREQEHHVVVFKVVDVPNEALLSSPQSPQQEKVPKKTQKTPQPMIYKVMREYVEVRGSRLMERLSLDWLDENHFDMNFQRRCTDHPE